MIFKASRPCRLQQGPSQQQDVRRARPDAVAHDGVAGVGVRDAFAALRRYLPGGVGLAAVVLLATCLIDLFSSATRATWFESRPWWQAVTPDRRQIDASLVKTFEVRGERLSARYELRVRKDDPIVAALQADDPPREALPMALGSTLVDGRPLMWGGPAITYSPAKATATIIFRSAPVDVSATAQVIVDNQDADCCLPPAKVVVRSERQVSSAERPVEQSEDHVVYDSLVGPLSFSLLRQEETQPRIPVQEAPLVAVDQRAVAEWQRVMEASASPAGRVDLTLRIDDQTLRAQYEVQLTDYDGDTNVGPLDAVHLLASADPADVARFLGVVEVGGRTLRFRPPLVLRNEDEPTAQLVLTSESVLLTRRDPALQVLPSSGAECCLPRTDVLLRTRDAQVQWSSPQATDQSASRITFQDLREGLRVGLVLTSFDAERTQERPSNAMVKRWNDVPVPGVGWALYWCAVAAPTALMLLWYGSTARPASRSPGQRCSGAARSLPVARALLAFYVLALLTTAAADLAVRWPLTALLAGGLREIGLWPAGRPDGSAAAVVMIALLAVGWPAAAASRLRPLKASESVPRQLAELALDTVVGATLATALLLGMRLRLSEPTGIADVLPIGLGTGAGLSLLMWLSLRLTRTHMSFAPRLGLLTALLLPASLLQLPSDDLLRRGVAAAITTTAGCLLLLGLARVVKYTLRWWRWDTASWQDGPQPTSVRRLDGPGAGGTDADRRSVLRQRWTRARQSSQRRLTAAPLVLTCALLAVPAMPVIGGAGEGVLQQLAGDALISSAGWNLIDLSNSLIYLLALCLGAVLVLDLRTHGSAPSLPGSRDARSLGLVFALTLLYDPFQRLFYLPIPLIVGYVLLTRWLVKDEPPPRVAAVLSGEQDRAELVRQAVEAGGARLRVPRPRLAPERQASSPAAGAVDDQQSAGADRERHVVHELTEAALSLGPNDEPWKNGVLFAKYLSLMSVPWALLYFLPRELPLWVDGDEYLTFGVLAAVAWNIAQWPALGFLFGYFYPLLRGPNGLWKGASVAAAYIGPWLMLQLAYESVDAIDTWQPFLVWAAQVFIATVLTGFLAGERQVLAAEGYRWSHSKSVHDFGALAAWGSTLGVAFVGAVVTVLTTTLGQVVAGGLGGGPTPPGGP